MPPVLFSSSHTHGCGEAHFRVLVRRVLLPVIVLCLLLDRVVAPKSCCPNEESYLLSGANVGWPNPKVRRENIACGRFKVTDIIQTRFQMFGSRAIILQPKLKPGVPFSVGQISLNPNKWNPRIDPFPSWSLHDPSSCDSIVNAVDIYLDSRGILWILDVGIINTLAEPEKKCGPKVIGIDCESGNISSVIELCSLLVATSRLQYLVVDYSGGGKAVVMISDAGSRAILVWKTETNEGYRVQLPRSVSEACSRDVLFLMLVRRRDNRNLLYISYLSSQHVFHMQSSVLHQKAKAGLLMECGKKPQRMVLLGTDNGQVIFFRFCSESNIYMWNSSRPFHERHFILAQTPWDARIPTHVTAGAGRLVWVLESNFQDFIQDCAGSLGASARLHPINSPLI